MSAVDPVTRTRNDMYERQFLDVRARKKNHLLDFDGEPIGDFSGRFYQNFFFPNTVLVASPAPLLALSGKVNALSSSGVDTTIYFDRHPVGQGNMPFIMVQFDALCLNYDNVKAVCLGQCVCPEGPECVISAETWQNMLISKTAYCPGPTTRKRCPLGGWAGHGTHAQIGAVEQGERAGVGTTK